MSNNKAQMSQLGISTDTSFNSKDFGVVRYRIGSIQVKFTGNSAGTYQVQVTNVPGRDKFEASQDDADWFNFGNSEASGGAAGCVAFSLENLPYSWVRVQYTQTSGTGTADIHAVFKD